MIREKQAFTLPGLLTLPLLLGLMALAIACVTQARDNGGAAFWIGTLIVCAICLGGHFVVNPNEGVVLQVFGGYTGTVEAAGLRWANPFSSKRRVSLRIRNFESAHLKVNDSEGNPIEIAAIVVWKVIDTAEACFEVDDYENYLKVQTEAAVRNLATRYPYDSHDEDDAKISLRGSTVQIAKDLRGEIHDRLAKAGLEVLDARLSHLAYAPEIAAAMLQRQQAGAIIAARQRIVDGAVGMVEMALDRLSKHKIVNLDEERKAAMISNLLVVLCGERAAQPVVNTGTIYT
jgi:regulator of protease activity HflC (stomatin/prohibitin superfamily)